MKLFHELSRKGPIPNIVTYNTLLRFMFKLGKVSIACEFWRKILASGQVPNTVTCSILLDGLCKTGKLEAALKLFQAMRNNGLELDIISYSVMIDGLCKTGHIEVAKKLFNELSFNGLKPNVYTYTMMIDGLSKERLSDEAHQLFGSMGDNDCLPDSCCYNVMIRGFLRNNYTLKATHLLAEMVDKGFSANTCTATFFVELILGSNESISMVVSGYFGCESDAKSSYNVELMFAASFDSKMECLYSVFDVKKQGKPIWEVRSRNWKFRESENRRSGLLEGVSIWLVAAQNSAILVLSIGTLSVVSVPKSNTGIWVSVPAREGIGTPCNAPDLSCGMARPRGGGQRGGRRGGRAPVYLDEIGMEPVDEETLPPPPPVSGEANEGGAGPQSGVGHQAGVGP
ncbi:hypothetical protein V6N13_054183 [Hibiscus sabdariffa]